LYRQPGFTRADLINGMGILMRLDKSASEQRRITTCKICVGMWLMRLAFIGSDPSSSERI